MTKGNKLLLFKNVFLADFIVSLMFLAGSYLFYKEVNTTTPSLILFYIYLINSIYTTHKLVLSLKFRIISYKVNNFKNFKMGYIPLIQVGCFFIAVSITYFSDKIQSSILQVIVFLMIVAALEMYFNRFIKVIGSIPREIGLYFRKKSDISELRFSSKDRVIILSDIDSSPTSYDEYIDGNFHYKYVGKGNEKTYKLFYKGEEFDYSEVMKYMKENEKQFDNMTDEDMSLIEMITLG